MRRIIFLSLSLGVSQFAFVDGSVRGLHKDIDRDVLISLSSIQNGEYVPLQELEVD